MNRPEQATLCLYTDDDFRIPAPEDIRAVIDMLDLTADQVAALVGVRDGRAVRRWLAPASSSSHAKITYSAWRLLLLEAGLVRLQRKRMFPR
jgi:hypothetical protein